MALTLNQFIAGLQKLAPEHGDKKVFYSHGASGDCGELSSAHVTNRVGDSGPFDLEPEEEYISIYAGN